MVGKKTVYARMDRPAGIISFAPYARDSFEPTRTYANLGEPMRICEPTRTSLLAATARCARRPKYGHGPAHKVAMVRYGVPMHLRIGICHLSIGTCAPAPLGWQAKVSE